MTNLTDIKPVDIITHIEQNFTRTQATGLNCLIFLALREETTVAYQHKEWAFEDIPRRIVGWCDSLEQVDLLNFSVELTNCLIHRIIPSKFLVKTRQSQLPQAIESQKHPL